MLLFRSDTWLKHTKTTGGFCSFTTSFVLSLLLSFLEGAIPIFERSIDSPFSFFHLYWVRHLVPMGKGQYAPFLFPWDIHSLRGDTWPRENHGHSEQARGLFPGLTAIQSAALWTLSGRRSPEKCLYTWRVSMSTVSAWHSFSWMTRYLQLLMPPVFGPFSYLFL